MTPDTWETLSRITIMFTLCSIVGSAMLSVYHVVRFFKRLDKKISSLCETQVAFTNALEQFMRRMERSV